ncbi:MAG: PAAR domain-containing protein [Dialister invisus]
MGVLRVFINGKPAGRIGDPVSCGGAVAEGSSNVFIGG